MTAKWPASILMAVVAVMTVARAGVITWDGSIRRSGEGDRYQLPLLDGFVDYQLFDPSIGTLDAVEFLVTVNSAHGWSTDVQTYPWPVWVSQYVDFEVLTWDGRSYTSNREMVSRPDAVWLSGLNAMAIFEADFPDTPRSYLFVRAPSDFVGTGTERFYYGMAGTTSALQGYSALTVDMNASVRYQYTPAAVPEAVGTGYLVLMAVPLLALSRGKR